MGANSIRLSIYTIENSEAKLLINKKETAGLASYVRDGALSAKGMETAAVVLESFKNILVNFDVADYQVFATASLRNISNTQEATEYILGRTGIAVNVMTGEEEAQLGSEGAFYTEGIRDGILVDIGGGSTEVVEFQNGETLSAVSIPVGSLSSFNKHVSSIFPTGKEARSLALEVGRELRHIGSLNENGHATIIGIGGSIRAAAKLSNELFELPPKNMDIGVGNLDKILQNYKQPDDLTLRTILRVAPERIHTLIPGLIILKTVADYCKAGTIRASRFSIREGYLYSRVLGAI